MFAVAPRRRVRASLTVLAVTSLLLACAGEEPEAPSADEPSVAEPAPDNEPPEPAEDGEEEMAEVEPPAELEEPEEPEAALGAYGVSAGDAHAVRVGMDILEAGGNAVDAAVATAVAVSVVEPFASGIGGGGAAIVALPGEEPVAIDYREVVAQDGVIPDTATGIPGFVSGMEHLLDEHGTLTFAEVLAPSIELARDGVATSGTMATQLQNAAQRLPVDELDHLFPDGTPLDAGDRLVQDDLADTLEALAGGGAAAFTQGSVGQTLAANIEGIDEESLAAYEVQSSPTASGPFAGYEVHAAAPPLPGASLVQMLQIAEAAGAAEQAPGSAELTHTIAMAWRLADAAIAEDLGDPAFVDVPVDRLTDPARNAELAGAIPSDQLASAAGDTTTLASAGTGGPEAGNTTHLTVVDAEGGMVSMTNTITNFWGSGEYDQGFFLNDQLARFSIGQGDNNVAEPGRRSVSWSLPALVTDDEGRPVLGVGSPGGRRIPIMLAQALVGWGLHGQSLEEVVTAPRFHLEGDELLVEQLPADEVVDGLRGRGYEGPTIPDPPLYFGSIQALQIDHEASEVIGARDDRREADVATARSD